MRHESAYGTPLPFIGADTVDKFMVEMKNTIDVNTQEPARIITYRIVYFRLIFLATWVVHAGLDINPSIPDSDKAMKIIAYV